MVDYISESVPVEQEVARLANEQKCMHSARRDAGAFRGRFAPVDDIIEDIVQTAKLRRA